MCAKNRVTCANNEEISYPMRPIDVGLVAEYLGMVPPNKLSHSPAGASYSSSIPKVQTMHGRLDHMERILDFHEQQLVF